MVAGFISALDNSIGWVGIAPGARLWDVRVLGQGGTANNSQVICGIDWVTSTRTDADPANDIAVANMSLAGPGTDDGNCGLTDRSPVHMAICRSVAAGVTYVVAAGNEDTDLAASKPASYQEVLTVTGIADQDGRSGALGGEFACLPGEQDDSAASFTNLVTVPADRMHVVAAPAVCIGSTFPGATYGVGSGTSFATPLVAGTVALCIAAGPCAGMTPAQVITKIVADAEAYNLANPTYGYEGDPLRPQGDRYYGYLINAGIY